MRLLLKLNQQANVLKPGLMGDTKKLTIYCDMKKQNLQTFKNSQFIVM
jgi:hypothetical protein